MDRVQMMCSDEDLYIFKISMLAQKLNSVILWGRGQKFTLKDTFYAPNLEKRKIGILLSACPSVLPSVCASITKNKQQFVLKFH